MGEEIVPNLSRKSDPQGTANFLAIGLIQAAAFPPELLRQVGYYGPAEGAGKAFRELAEGLDVAVVRVVAARPGVESVRAVMDACQPE